MRSKAGDGVGAQSYGCVHSRMGKAWEWAWVRAMAMGLAWVREMGMVQEMGLAWAQGLAMG